MRKLKIAQISPVIESVPPKKYGGIERVIHGLTEELVNRGHDVTLFATADSKTSARLVSVTPKALRSIKNIDPYGPNAVTALNYGLAYQMQDKFDIIHDHLGPLTLPTANLANTPVVTTMHQHFSDEAQALYGTLTNPHVVTISYNQYPTNSGKINYAGTVYNGLQMEDYPFSGNPKGYLLFVGRITIEKGVHYAIKAAQALDMPLIIAAKLEKRFKPDMDYFNNFVKPALSKKIKWIGEVDEQTRNKLMSKAYCTLHPVTWPEPFGLTMIEAMACGSPVIGFRVGSIPEIIEHGKTGYVVSDVKGMIRAISKISKIKRSDCRDRALNTFSAKCMAEGYEEVYMNILESKKLLYPEDKFLINQGIDKDLPLEDET